MRRTSTLQQISRSATCTPLRSSLPSSSSLVSRIATYSSSSRQALLSQSRRAPAWSLPARRWYADSATTEKPVEEGEQKKQQQQAEGESAGAGGAAELEKAKAEIEAKNKEIADIKDKWLRSVADFRNLQERAKREQASARDFALTKFSKDLIESIDNLDRAMGVVPAEKLTGDDVNVDLKNLHDGLKMTEEILMKTLAKHGLERFDPSVEGEKFDPNRHETAFFTKMPDKEDGTVFNTMQKGFVLNGRIIRAAKVGVVKNA